MGKWSEKRIEALRQEKVGGATVCLRMAMEAVRDCPESELERVCDQLVEAQPDMAPIFVATRRCLEKGKGEAEKIVAEMEKAGAVIARKAADLCKRGDRILTHSASSTVREALLLARPEKEIEVVVTESQPMCEGRLLAQQLEKAGVPARVILDAAAASTIPQCQAVWVGADAIMEDSFVNKVGTLGIALAAKRLEVPFYVLANRFKILPKGLEWDVKDPNFERVPSFLLTQILSDG